MENEKKVIKAFVAITDEEVEERKKTYDEYIEMETKRFNEELQQQIIKEGAKEKGPEEKEYLILFVDIEDPERNWFNLVTGRTEAYQEIRNNIEAIDIHKSSILVEGVVLEKRISVYAFMRHVQDKGFFEGESFDIEDYNVGDDEEEYNNTQPVTNTETSNNEDADEGNEGIKKVNPFMYLDADSKDI